MGILSHCYFGKLKSSKTDQQPLDIKFSFSNNYILLTGIINNSDTLKVLNKSGVYKLKFT